MSRRSAVAGSRSPNQCSLALLGPRILRTHGSPACPALAGFSPCPCSNMRRRCQPLGDDTLSPGAAFWKSQVAGSHVRGDRRLFETMLCRMRALWCDEQERCPEDHEIVLVRLVSTRYQLRPVTHDQETWNLFRSDGGRCSKPKIRRSWGFSTSRRSLA